MTFTINGPGRLAKKPCGIGRAMETEGPVGAESRNAALAANRRMQLCPKLKPKNGVI